MNKNIITSAITAIIVALVVVSLVGGNPDNLGGSRFPSGISADSTLPSAGQVRGTTLTATGALTGASGALSGAFGVASSTVGIGDLAVGTASATSTIAGGFFCSYFEDEAGRGMYITLATSGNTVFATSTSSCN